MSALHPKLTGRLRWVNSWLNRQTTWQFALTWGCCIFLATVIAGGAGQWLFKRHFDPSFLLGYAAVFTLISTGTATFERKRRLRQAARTSDHLPPQEP